MLRIFSHPDCAGHVTPNGHPECPARLAAAMRSLERMPNVDFRQADEAGNELIGRVHTAAHIKRLERIDERQSRQAIDPDTFFGPGSLRAARLATGAVIGAVDQVAEGRCQRAFAVVRPPGHHAESNRAMGFCYFNNIAVAAAHAIAAQGFERVAICDFDVHHGNGSEEIFAGSDQVLFASSHQLPLFPGTGDPTRAVSANVHNAALPPGATSDAFRDLWLGELLPAIEVFRPQLVLVSAGFDGHAADPLAQLRLKDEDFHWIGLQLRQIADAHADGRLIASLEGGYDLGALERSVEAFADALV